MKRLLAYLLLLNLLIIFVSACGTTTPPPSSTSSTSTLTVQLMATYGNGNVTLDWQMVEGADTYNIYYIADPTGDTYSSTNKPSSTTMQAGTKVSGVISAPYTITPLTNTKLYWFSISAVNYSGESDLSSPVSATPSSATPPPAIPDNVRANAGDAQVTVTWTPVTGIDHYILYCYWQEGLTAGEGVVDIPQAQSSQIVDSATTIEWIAGSGFGPSSNTSPVNGMTYYFWIISDTIASDNCTGSTCNTSFVVSATPSTTPPPFAPVLSISSTPSPIGNQYVDLQWNSVTGATSYNVYYGTAQGVTKEAGVSPSSARGVTVTSGEMSNLTNCVTYYFVVTAVNANGESAESNEVAAMPTTGSCP
ncbi:MAG: hypothetical protein ABSC11_05795 [Smithella sp.]